MDDPREAAIHETERLLEVARELHASLRINEAIYRKVLRKLRQEKRVEEILQDVDAKAARQQLNDALTVLEESRHRARRSLIAAGLDEGMTIGGAGRAWGISRQLASRYAKEIRGRT